MLSIGEYKEHGVQLTKDEWVALSKDLINNSQKFNSDNTAWEVTYDQLYRGFLLQIVENFERSLSYFPDAKFKKGLMDSIGIKFQQADSSDEYLVA